MRPGFHELLTAAAVAPALALAGCGGSPATEAPADAAAGAESTLGRSCRAGSFRPLGSERRAYAAAVQAEAWTYRRPGRGPLRHFGRLNANGVPTVFGVRGAVVDHRCRPQWYRVQLPMRPNGIVGYVRARDVHLGSVRTRIVIDVSARRLTFLRDGREVLHATVAVGSSSTPTPTGRFYVNQRLIPTDPSGPFGPGAIGISAFSNVLTGWTQGGPIAIHGTNRPTSIGQAVSNGCIRLPNATLRRVFGAAFAGTPVVVRP